MADHVVIYAPFNGDMIRVASLPMSYIPAVGEVINVRSFLEVDRIMESSAGCPLLSRVESHLLIVKRIVVTFKQNGTEVFDIDTDFEARRD